jgi:hypothetical protein
VERLLKVLCSEAFRRLIESREAKILIDVEPSILLNKIKMSAFEKLSYPNTRINILGRLAAWLALQALGIHFMEY